MARLNVEDELWGDDRFKDLCRLMRDEDQATGLVIRFWKLAQKYWGDEQLIPHKIFERGGYEALLEVDLAVDSERGVYCRGARERFGWYLQKCRASRSAAAKRAGLPDPIFLDPATGRPESETRPTEPLKPVDRKPKPGPPESESRPTGSENPDHPPALALVPAPAPAPIPPNPPLTRRDAEVEAGRAVDAIMYAMLKRESAEGAERLIGPYSWPPIKRRYVSWANVCTEIGVAHQAGELTKLQTSVEKFLRRALKPPPKRATAPPAAPGLDEQFADHQ